MEFKVPALLRSPHAPAREYPRDVDHVLLGVAAIHAQRVQLEQLAGVILVDALGHARERLAAQRVRAHRIVSRIEQWRATEHRAWAEQWSGAQPHRLRRRGTGRHALPIVEVEQHGGALW